MPYPRLDDNGMTVTLDLHGASVHEAIDIVYRVLDVAVERGRSSVKIIHGHSTSNGNPHERTIKKALHDEIDRGGFPEATGVLKQQGHLVLSLDITMKNDPRRINTLDAFR